MNRTYSKTAAGALTATLMIIAAALTLPGCGGGGLFGLQDYQRDLLFGAGSLAVELLNNGQDGATDTVAADPIPGKDGLSCWDQNGDGVADPEEDINGDGLFNADDCQGADGTTGIATDGTNGADGAGGLNCWDLNGNGATDPEEDINGDGLFTADDCRGADGRHGSGGGSGPTGAAGMNCWDLNGNGVADPEEDINGDGAFTSEDCQGPPSASGTDGINCWDLNGDGINDPAEDTNGDELFTVEDCRGADGTNGLSGTDGASGANGANGANGAPGADGANGIDGANGTNGLSCWDVNGDGVANPDEDINGDGLFNAEDCRGADGEPGGVSDIFFDTFIDDFFTVGHGSYRSSHGDEAGLSVVEIQEPALGPSEVVAYRTVVPFFYDETGHDTPDLDQNQVTMRIFFWREGPREDCFVFRLDAFRSRHGQGVAQYGGSRYVKLDDPVEPNPMGTLVVIDLPLNNVGDNPADGLCFPGDLRVGDFLAFELNIVQDTLINDDVSYTMMGVEFFETPAGDTFTTHATVFKSVQDVDCSFVEGCPEGSDCDEHGCASGTGHCDDDEPECDDDHDGECVPCDHEPQDGQTVICHVSSDDGESSHTIAVADEAVPAHLDHGDTLGFCAGDCGDGE